jgi:hypothetical protein
VNRDERQAFEAFVSESGDALLRIAVLLTADPDLAQGPLRFSYGHPGATSF